MTETRRQWGRRVRHRVMRGLLIVVAGSLSGAVVGASAAAASAGSLSLDGLVATTTVGSTVPFTASLTNDGPDPVATLKLVISVVATGVDPQCARIERRELDGTWSVVVNKTGSKGDVKFVDDSYKDRSMLVGGALTGRYRLTFLAGTPAGLAIISATAHDKTTGSWQSLAKSPQYLTNIVMSAGSGGGNPPPASVGSSSRPGRQRSALPSQTPMSAAATIGDGPAAGSGWGQPASGVVTASRPAALAVVSGGRPWPLSSRFATSVGIGLVVVLLIAVGWLLRRQINVGAGSGGGGDGDVDGFAGDVGGVR
jgi:hypothetical protein